MVEVAKADIQLLWLNDCAAVAWLIACSLRAVSVDIIIIKFHFTKFDNMSRSSMSYVLIMNPCAGLVDAQFVPSRHRTSFLKFFREVDFPDIQ